MAVLYQRDQEPDSCFVHEAECLRNSNLALKAYGILLEPQVVSPCWKLKEDGSNLSKGISSGSNR